MCALSVICLHFLYYFRISFQNIFSLAVIHHGTDLPVLNFVFIFFVSGPYQSLSYACVTHLCLPFFF